jgi:quercetin dioxygenase-like cupin family protein
MSISRRDLRFLLPALAAAGAPGQQRRPGPLPPKVYNSDRIPYEGDQKKKGRRFFMGPTHSGFGLEVHETILGGGQRTHEPHKHEHEEIVFVIEGTVEAYFDGKTELAPPGSVIYFGSNQMHSARNAGEKPCRYYVVELRGAEM